MRRICKVDDCGVSAIAIEPPVAESLLSSKNGSCSIGNRIAHGNKLVYSKDELAFTDKACIGDMFSKSAWVDVE